MVNAGEDIANANYEKRKEYGLSFDGLNVYRIINGMSRQSCSTEGNPCDLIQKFSTSNGITVNEFLMDFKKYKSQAGLISASSYDPFELTGELGIVPKEKNNYLLMSAYDLAMMKIKNDEISAIDFNDNEPNWPIFKTSLTDLPWQILSIA